MMGRYKIPLYVWDDSGPSRGKRVEVVEALGITNIGQRSGVLKADHDKMCEAWGVNPDHVQYCHGEAEVSLLLGMDCFSYLGDRVTTYQGKKIPEIFPFFSNFFLKSGLITQQNKNFGSPP